MNQGGGEAVAGPLVTIAWIGLALGGISAATILIHILAGHRQRMWIMNLVWPVTGLYSGPVGLWAYWRFGRLTSRRAAEAAEARGEKPPGKRKPFWQITAVAATHCGAGCTLGDILAESLLILAPFTLFGQEIFAGWLVDFGAAYLLGIAFQYYTIAPMRGLSPGAGLLAAVKADTLSLTAWQLGMYGWMAIATFGIFGHPLDKTGPVFWFMMQIAMLAGFATAYPVNWWLVRSGLKEKM